MNTEELEMQGKKALEIMAALNSVDGFNPYAVAREKTDENSPTGKSSYLPLEWKKMWARIVYPTHRCHAEVKSVKDGYVSAYAAFYIDNDPAKAPIGEGFAYTQISTGLPTEKAVAEAVLLSIGSAKTRAYSDAGFGLQFWTGETDDDMSNAYMKQSGSLSDLLPVDPSPENEDPQPKERIPENAGGDLSEMLEIQEYDVEVKRRSSQYEMAKKDNEELLVLAKRIPLEVDRLMATSAGSAEYTAAETALSEIRTRWNKLSGNIAKRMTMQKVLADRDADKEYTFMSQSFDQVLWLAKANAELKTEAEPEATEETKAPSEPVQMTFVEEMDIEKARSMVSTCGPYAGKTFGEIYDATGTRQMMPKLYERTADEREKKAIALLIRSDRALMAYCERAGKDLSA